MFRLSVHSRFFKQFLTLILVSILFIFINLSFICQNSQSSQSSQISSVESNREKLKNFFYRLQTEKNVLEDVNKAKDLFSKRLLHFEFEKLFNPNGTFVHSEANKNKDQFSSMNCFDHSRVVLSKDYPDSNDYINANYIDGYQQSKKFISTQCMFQIQ